MSIEEDIATFIANNTSLSLGSDIYLHNLPEDDGQGLAVKPIRHVQNFGAGQTTRFGIFFLYKNWVSEKSKIDTIVNLFEDKRGKISSSWAIKGEIETQYFGMDEYDRYISTILINITH